MYTTNLRKVGGSVMLAVPRALLDTLRLAPGAKVGMAIDKGRLVVEPQTKPSYSLEELLSQCDAAADFSEEDSAWLDAPSVGKEVL